VLAQRQQGLVEGVTLGDAAEIQPHARLVEADGVRSVVQVHLLPGDELAGCLPLLIGRQAARLPCGAPELNIRADRDIKRAARAFC
jgi:hypothetical protein